MRFCKTKGCENPKAHFESGMCWTCYHIALAKKEKTDD